MPKKSSHQPTQTDSRDPMVRVWAAYYLTLAAFFAASFFPEARLWGINWWGYHPIWLRIVLLALLGAVLPILSVWMKSADKAREMSAKAYWTIAGVVTIGLTVLFWLLRAKTHFLGDGYTLISLMASEQPLVKMRNLGGTIFPLFVTNLLGGKTTANVELAYQLVSVGSGTLFLLLAFWSGRRLFEHTTKRFLWVLLLISGGYTLQFFGYVENYSVFLLAVALYCVVGILIAEGHWSRWWILPANGLVLFLHVFGVTLLPASAYLLIQGTDLGRRLGRLTIGTKWLIGFVVALIAAIVFLVVYQRSVYVQTALMPPVNNVFTYDGYTLFSWRHILDYANLLLLLCPGLAVLALLAGWPNWRELEKSPATVVSILATLGGLTAVFVFEPKLGMPRDWDLFAYPGVPLLILLGLLALRQKKERALPVLLGVVLVGLTMVTTRAWVAATPELGVKQFQTAFSLDAKKNRPALFALREYYRAVSDSTSMLATDSLRSRRFPEEDLAKFGQRLFNQGQIPQGKQVLDRAMHLNPTYADTWLGYAMYFIYTRQFDSAQYYLHIADGLNPYSPSVAAEYGRLAYFRGDAAGAERHWQDATAMSADFDIGLYNLAQMYMGRGDTVKYVDYMAQSAARKSASWTTARELADFLAARGQSEKARQFYELALSKGMDSASYLKLVAPLP